MLHQAPLAGIRPVSRQSQAWLVWPAALIALGTVLQAPLIRMSISGDLYAFRQSQTAMVVREFVRSGFDWRTPLPVFGTSSYVPMEFPIFQGMAAFLCELTGIDVVTATRLMGLLCFQACAALSFWLLLRWFNRTAAVSGLGIFEFTSFGVYWGHAALIDFLPVALMLLSAALLECASSSPRVRARLLLGAGAITVCTLGFLAKSTTGIVLVPVIFIPALNALGGLRGKGSKWWFVLPLSAVGAGLAATVIWTRVADSIKSSNSWTTWLTSSSLQQWNFGTLSQRLDLVTWQQVMDVSWGGVMGGLLVYLLVSALAVFGWRPSPAPIVLFATPLLGPIIFTNLYLVHTYYSIAVYPVLVMLVGAAIGLLARVNLSRRVTLMACLLASVSVVGLSWIGPQGREFAANLRGPHGTPDLASVITINVPAEEGVLFFGCDWDPTVPFYADRRALMIVERAGPVISASEVEEYPFAAFCGEPSDAFDVVLKRRLPPGTQWQLRAPALFQLELRNADAISRE